MAITVTGEQILQAVLQRSDLGITLLNAEIGSLAAGSVTSVLHLRNGNWSTNEFRTLRGSLFRPGNATGMADYQRAVGDLTISTGALANDANWSDTTIGTENVYVFKHGLTGRDFLNALTRAMKLSYVRGNEALSILADGSLQSSVTTSWTESDADGGPATTFTKVNTADSENVWGANTYGGRTLNAAANGYIRQRVNVTRGETIYAGRLCRADVGTASLVLYDVTNSVELGSAVTTTEEQWQYLSRTQTMGAATEILEVRLQGVESNADIYDGGAFVYRVRNNRIRLPDYLDTAFRVTGLAYGVFEGDGYSLRQKKMREDEYTFDIERPGANPNWIIFKNNHWFQYPIWVVGRYALSRLTTFTLALSETTAGDLDLITALTWRELMKQEARDVPGAKALLDEANLMLRTAEARVEDEGPEEKVEYWGYGAR